MVRRASSENFERIAHIVDRVELRQADLLDQLSLVHLLRDVQPDEVYNLAAQSFIPTSFSQPLLTGEFTALGVTRLLEAVRLVNPAIRFYQASSSEMFGKVQETPQSETTPFHPRSPYGVAKLYGHWITVNYRESYDLYAASGILFNHESPLRGQEFVTRKISLSLAKIKHGQLDVLGLGNLADLRDWGYAGDYVEGMWRMLQQQRADDYVLATGESHSVRDFVMAAGRCLGFDFVFEGTGVDERGIDRKTGRTLVKVDPKFYRPAEVDHLCGNPAKAQHALGWERKTTFPQLVETMAEADERRVRDNRLTF